MIYIFLSICCSVFVSVLLKLARRYQIDTRQAITWNYSIAALLTWIFYDPVLPEVYSDLLPVYIALGILLPSIFVFLALSVRYTGIVRTDVAQRLSLFIPVLAAFLVFGEDHSPIKILGISLAFLAIICSVPWQKKERNSSSYWIYPVIVFIGMGVIDILFKQIALYTNLPYTSSLFIVFALALAIMTAVIGFEIAFKKARLNYKNLLFGALVGIFNFGNILFYLKAHQSFSENPSTVFAGMNMGVIIVGSLTGIFIFKEKLSKMNYAGLFLALVAIILIVMSQL